MKITKKTQPRQTAAGKARAEGLRLFRVAGRPMREQVILVYGERGPVMTWAQRAAAGVPAAKFSGGFESEAVGAISRVLGLSPVARISRVAGESAREPL